MEKLVVIDGYLLSHNYKTSEQYKYLHFSLDAFPLSINTNDSEEIIKTIKYLEGSFGGINLEDISAPRCFDIEKRLIIFLL